MGCVKSTYMANQLLSICDIDECENETFGDSILCNFHYLEVLSYRMDQYEKMRIDVTKILSILEHRNVMDVQIPEIE